MHHSIHPSSLDTNSISVFLSEQKFVTLGPAFVCLQRKDEKNCAC